MPALVARLPKPRIIWVMLPAGDITEGMLVGRGGLISLQTRGDVIIDGGNSFYEDLEAISKLTFPVILIEAKNLFCLN